MRSPGYTERTGQIVASFQCGRTAATTRGHNLKGRILITGGAGFIGSHLADELLVRGYKIRVLDNLSEQVHGPDAIRPSYLNEDIELMVGDVRDREAVTSALKGVDAVFHF